MKLLPLQQNGNFFWSAAGKLVAITYVLFNRWDAFEKYG